MSIVSITFSKISAEKSKPIKGKVNVANNVAIKDIKKANFKMANVEQNSLRFSFEFTSKTEPEIGNITLEGDVVYILEKEKMESVLKSWEEKKPVQKDVITPVINAILKKSNIEALMLSQTMNLPSPVKLPSVDPSKASEHTESKTEASE